MKKTKVEVGEDVACYHCGNPCDEVRIEVEEKLFCCDGCHLVFQILDESGLCSYYDIENHPELNWFSQSHL